MFEGNVVFAGSATYPPHQWLGEDDEPHGFVVELENQLAEQGGTQAEHLLLPWKEALQAVISGDADAVALFLSEQRREYFDFTEPFYYVPHAIFSHKNGERLASLGDLVGYQVAVVAGGYAEQRLSQDYPNVQLLKVPNERDCLEVVASRSADACVEATHTARYYASDLPVIKTSAPFWPRPYVFGVRKGNDELRDWLDRQLSMAIANGTYGDIYQRWQPRLRSEDTSFFESLKALAWIAFPIIFMAVLGWCCSWYFKRKVSDRTRQLTEELVARRQLQGELEYRAGHDLVTGLPNRGKFVADLDKHLQQERSEVAAVILIRLLNVEQIISIFGYQVFRELLQNFGQRLKAMGFIQVGHFGSGVFAVVPSMDISYQHIVDNMIEPFELGTISLDAQVVMGVSHNEGESSIDAEELLRRSMTAFSTASKAEKTWVIYSPELEPDPKDIFLLQQFRRQGTRDMFLVFQPKLDLATGYIKGAEALLRWSSPELGAVSPGKFIPILEKSGLITEVTHWVVEQAWSAMFRFQERDGSFGVSANIAARDLMSGCGLVDLIQSLQGVRETQRLCLEVTETGVIEDYEHAIDVLSTLRASGVHCAVDDFGTGYASLSYLSKLPIDEVKLDRSFIKDMVSNRQNHAIVASTIELAHTLNLKVTAEGVEDMDTLRALAALGCDTAQGYIISRPIAESDLIHLLGRPYLKVSQVRSQGELST
ncbi:EAL domain-containing protein [Halomonas beimenensis]|uniref:EAL domain-containing protein n=1 Tax=Halomonas beimenensis TaxID=475662 RepID=UPI0036229F18